MHERPGDGDALLLAARQLRWPVREAVADADRRDELLVPRAVGLAPGERERQQDVLLRVQHRHEVEALKDEAELVAPQAGQLTVVEARELGAVNDDRAGGRAVQAGEQVHERRLARAGRPHDGGEAADREVDGHVDEGTHGGVALAERAAQVNGRDNGPSGGPDQADIAGNYRRRHAA